MFRRHSFEFLCLLIEFARFADKQASARSIVDGKLHCFRVSRAEFADRSEHLSAVPFQSKSNDSKKWFMNEHVFVIDALCFIVVLRLLSREMDFACMQSLI